MKLKLNQVQNIYAFPVLFVIFILSIEPFVSWYQGPQPFFFNLPILKSFAFLNTLKPIKSELPETHVVK